MIIGFISFQVSLVVSFNERIEVCDDSFICKYGWIISLSFFGFGLILYLGIIWAYLIQKSSLVSYSNTYEYISEIAKFLLKDCDKKYNSNYDMDPDMELIFSPLQNILLIIIIVSCPLWGPIWGIYYFFNNICPFIWKILKEYSQKSTFSYNYCNFCNCVEVNHRSDDDYDKIV